MIAEILKKYPFVVLDGAFSTPLEQKGFHTNDPLWTALALYQAPDLAEEIHREYFEAGADIGMSSSYQATIPGFERKGFSEEEARALIRRSVELVQEARDSFLAEDHEENRPVPLVAAAVGPYGAFLADGSEYRGQYGKSREWLADWHRPRILTLWETRPDLFALETIPSLTEALAETDVLKEIPEARCWVSFTCKDGEQTWEGNPIEECMEALNNNPQIEAVGINCTAPKYVESLVRRMASVSDKPILVYPNSGEEYDPETKTWKGGASRYEDYLEAWYNAGARLIGGCCRTTAREIRAVSRFRQSLMK